MEHSLLEQLTQLGFTDQQAKLYLAGLTLGDCLMAHLAHEANIKRSTAYYAMSELQRRGFFSVKKLGKRTYYIAATPQVMMRMTTKRLALVKKMYPQLEATRKK